MRDYEMVELKLLVAVEEGASARGLTVSDGEFRVERLMPGLYVLGVPTRAGCVPVVMLTDDFDLGLLGFATETRDAAMLVHDFDITSLREKGVDVDLSRFEQREPLPGWNFAALPLHDSGALNAALAAILPAYTPAALPPKLPLDI